MLEYNTLEEFLDENDPPCRGQYHKWSDYRDERYANDPAENRMDNGVPLPKAPSKQEARIMCSDCPIFGSGLCADFAVRTGAAWGVYEGRVRTYNAEGKGKWRDA